MTKKLFAILMIAFAEFERADELYIVGETAFENKNLAELDTKTATSAGFGQKVVTVTRKEFEQARAAADAKKPRKVAAKKQAKAKTAPAAKAQVPPKEEEDAEAPAAKSDDND